MQELITLNRDQVDFLVGFLGVPGFGLGDSLHVLTWQVDAAREAAALEGATSAQREAAAEIADNLSRRLDLLETLLAARAVGGPK